ncbi:MAG: peptidoglycan-associated lipoprotein Pal [Deltaproteobacteria bacterium]|nr:peptidoglycan-associated lipoprotein Pal [Deltaproteobacteria bacterium]
MLRYTLIAALILAAGCKKKPIDEPIVSAPVVEEKPKVKEVPPPVVEMTKNFSRVFFEFDSANLTSDGKSALDANAGIMGQYSDIRLEIQGHADERGTTEYNLALGQKRADAVVRYLLQRGVSTSRVKSVSYGEERPLDGRSTETAWEQNRRAEFVVSWSGDAPVQGTSN